MQQSLTKTNSNYRIGKYIAIGFAALAILTVIALPLIAHGQEFDTRLTVPGECNAKECGWVELVKLGNQVLSFGIFLAVLGATLAIVWAGWKMTMNMGNDGEVKEAKKILWKAIVGIVITMSAYMIVQFILDNLGVDNAIRFLVK